MTQKHGTAPTLCLLLVAGGIGGCVAPGEGNRFERHFRSDLWLDALNEEFNRPEQWVPAVTLAVATPILYANDQRIQDHVDSGSTLTGGREKTGNTVTAALGVLALGFGGYKWADGDRGEAIEVAGEAILLTEISAGILKKANSRVRPNGHSEESFPSGHTAFAFSAATILAREIEYREESSLGYLFYIPAAYVGLSRVESDRHFASDVAAGAFLGIVIANTVFNLHYGDEREKNPGGMYERPSRSAWQLVPFDGVNTVGIALRYSF